MPALLAAPMILAMAGIPSAIGAGAGPASAAEACAGVTQPAINACSAAEARRADADLNAAYEELARRVGPRTKDALRAAQRAWLAYRDASCTLEMLGSEGGSVQPMVRSGCYARFTQARTAILRGYLTCEEGDLACVGRFGD